MAERDIYVDLNLQKVNQVKNARVQNVTTSERTTLAATLGAGNEGLTVWDTTEKLVYYWNGASFVQGASTIQGAMIYKGAITDAVNAPSSPQVGYTYLWNTTTSTLTWATQTFNPNAVVSQGDMIVYRGSNVWDTIQADDDLSSETIAGNVRLATTAETNAGTDNTTAITPSKLTGYVSNKGITRGYYNNAINVTANTPATVTHNLALSNKDSFLIRIADSTGSEVSLDVDSVDVNSLTITSAVTIIGLKVFVVGM